MIGYKFKIQNITGENFYHQQFRLILCGFALQNYPDFKVDIKTGGPKRTAWRVCFLVLWKRCHKLQGRMVGETEEDIKY